MKNSVKKRRRRRRNAPHFWLRVVQNKSPVYGLTPCKSFRCGRRASRLFVDPNKKLLDQRYGCARTCACMRATRSSPNISWAQQLCYSFAKTSCLALPSHVYCCVHITVCDLHFFRFGLSECTDMIRLTLHQEITHIHTGVCLCHSALIVRSLFNPLRWF